MNRKEKVASIEEELGFNKIKPIQLSPGDAKDESDMTDEQQQAMREWYEDELIYFYENELKKDSD